ncbi:APC family permease [Paenarthrobacter sp. NPDC058040]|uniref:APC family permease n=1 Tax=unclassified Paenarthrobacter TaxID=2634190 RepID=UPI0036DAD8BF
MSSTNSTDEAVTPLADQVPPQHLRGNMGVLQLFFTVMAFNAPLVVVIGFIPVMIAYGNGIGTPAIFIVCGAIVLLFATGFTAMARHLPNPGGFYAYITAGLGKPVGLGSSFVALACYYFSLLSSYALGGMNANFIIHQTLGGPDVPWWVWSIALFVIVSTLGYLRIDLSAKVLSVFLIAELAIVVIYDLAVGIQGGASGFSLESFMPQAIMSGSIGLALMFGVGMFGGFEATAIFRDEVKDPRRTVPRATFLVICTVAVLYGLTAWVIIASYGTGEVVAAATADPAGSVQASIGLYAGHIIMDIAIVLMNTSTFAVLLSAHNITARYVFNLSADRILHHSLSRPHPRYGSPHRASVFTSIAAVVGLVPFVIAGAPVETLYAVFGGGFSYTLVALLFLTALAIPFYMKRNRVSGVSNFTAVLAPGLAVIGFGIALVLSTQNFALLIGGSEPLAGLLFTIIYALFALGVVMAVAFRKRRPDVYARIGRQE